jgi:methyl-accepting chemotaxis protein
VRTLSSTSRILSAAAVIAAAAMVLGGAYFAGYISELQRDLNDPGVHQQAARHIGSIEKALGYDGFIKIYRNYRLTGEPAAPSQLSRKAAEAIVAIRQLQAIYFSNPAAAQHLREANTIAGTFDQIARTAPQMGSLALRGTASMDTLATLPQTPQLEAAYLSLRGALDRLKQAEQAHQLGGIASALSWSQALILGALASIVTGLLVAAGLLHLGIINPLKTLERSLTSLGDGNVGQRVWGTDRDDEIGQLARASEKLRRNLTETEALKILADNSQLRINIEGQGAFLFEKLASDVTSAAEALKGATAELAKQQSKDRSEIEAALSGLNQASRNAGETADALRRDGEAAIQSVRASTDELLGTAKQRAERLDQIAARFEHGSQQMETVVSGIKVNAALVVEEFAGATNSIKRLAGDTQQIQAAFFTSCDKISSDAAQTTDKVRALTSSLTDAIGTVDNRLADKLKALDELEQGLTATLRKLENGSNDTIEALSKATGALNERGAANETRLEKTADDFEEILRLFRDGTVVPQSSPQADQLADATALLRELAERLAAPAPQPADTDSALQSLSMAIRQDLETVRGEIRDLGVRMTTEQATADAAAQQPSPQTDQLAEATALLREIAGRLAAPADTDNGLQSLSTTLRQDMEAVRNEIRDLGVRMTEERILSSAGSQPFAIPQSGGQKSKTPTLADVPGAELMARLQDLAAEMNAAQNRTDQTASLKSALGAFAEEVRLLAPGADRSARLVSLGKALDHHAGEIEAHAAVVEPSATALRGELQAITGELRTIAARAQANATPTDAPVLRESAIELGARAESLYTYLSNTQHQLPDDDEQPAQTVNEDANGDMAALTQLIAKLEARAEATSKDVIASRFEDISDTLSPAERAAKTRTAERQTGSAIQTVFESIERLNNIAAALARAGDIERRRKAAG